MKRSQHIIVFIFLLLISTVRIGAASSPSEYQVKAAYIYNFVKFITWNSESLGDSASAVVIGILGNDPFGPVLDETVAGKTVKGHPIKIKRLEEAEFPNPIHVLFISDSERNYLQWILKHAQLQQHVLTVSEMPGFIENGGMINLVMEGKNVRFEVNMDAVNKAGIKMSSKLLKLARIVKDE